MSLKIFVSSDQYNMQHQIFLKVWKSIFYLIKKPISKIQFFGATVSGRSEAESEIISKKTFKQELHKILSEPLKYTFNYYYRSNSVSFNFDRFKSASKTVDGFLSVCFAAYAPPASAWLTIPDSNPTIGSFDQHPEGPLDISFKCPSWESWPTFNFLDEMLNGNRTAHVQTPHKYTITYITKVTKD
ncbi:hypothetical protein NQ317_010828 [Molorchus minor]|uniref:Uncharacterized protein n=1 Tax=Molorchus minor TaxID=1323400 RepID=A0ABQ9JKT6_9CUCU|nr:hypothetical protein NQ317_010828 [Molorchus minor]